MVKIAEKKPDYLINPVFPCLLIFSKSKEFYAFPLFLIFLNPNINSGIIRKIQLKIPRYL